MLQNICVFCSSSNNIAIRHFATADEMGQMLAERGYTLIYGGGNVGLMGQLARSVHAHNGRVVGVIPERLKAVEGVAYDVADELIITETMQERKATMYSRADAFLVLPGGFGTLEEFLEILTLRQLGYHNKGIVLVNTYGFFDTLLRFFDYLYEEQVARRHSRPFYYVAEDSEDALRHLEETASQ